jgi:hypothetical protein
MEELVKLFSTVDKLVLSSLTHELTTAMLTLGSFFNSSKANWTSTKSGLTIRASTGEQKHIPLIFTSVTLES